jgi:hypothetical protein
MQPLATTRRVACPATRPPKSLVQRRRLQQKATPSSAERQAVCGRQCYVQIVILLKR